MLQHLVLNNCNLGDHGIEQIARGGLIIISVCIILSGFTKLVHLLSRFFKGKGRAPMAQCLNSQMLACGSPSPITEYSLYTYGTITLY